MKIILNFTYTSILLSRPQNYYQIVPTALKKSFRRKGMEDSGHLVGIWGIGMLNSGKSQSK